GHCDRAQQYASGVAGVHGRRAKEMSWRACYSWNSYNKITDFHHSPAGITAMSTETSHDHFNIERHGEIAVVTPSARVEEMHETMIEQAARMVIQSLKSDPPAGIVVDLSQVTYFGSVFVSFLLRCHSQARKHGSEIVLAGASEPARELLKLLDLETLWAI